MAHLLMWVIDTNMPKIILNSEYADLWGFNNKKEKESTYEI